MTRARTHARAHTHARLHTHNTRARAHTHTHTHTHACVCRSNCGLLRLETDGEESSPQVPYAGIAISLSYLSLSPHPCPSPPLSVPYAGIALATKPSRSKRWITPTQRRESFHHTGRESFHHAPDMIYSSSPLHTHTPGPPACPRRGVGRGGNRNGSNLKGV